MIDQINQEYALHFLKEMFGIVPKEGVIDDPEFLAGNSVYQILKG
jgi:hypothetical protein